MKRNTISRKRVQSAKNWVALLVGVFIVLGAGAWQANAHTPTLSPNAAQPGATVMIAGEGFGPFISTQENKVLFNGRQALIQRWDPTLITVKVPLRAQDGPVTLLIGEKTRQAGSFTVHQPRIDRITPSEAEAGARLVLEGQHFGNTAGSRDSHAMFGVNQVLINGTPGDIIAWESTKIEVQIPPTAKSGDVLVRLASYDPLSDGSCCAPVEYAASNPKRLTVLPTIAMQPTEGPVGSKVVLSGQNFGDSKRQGDAILFNGHLATIASWSPRTIVAHVPLHATSGPLTLQRDGAEREIGNFTVHKMQVNSVSRQEGPIGSLVRIRGAHFGIYSESGDTPYYLDFNTGGNAVEIGGVPAIIHRWQDNLIDVWVPYSAESGPIVIKRGGTQPKQYGTCCAEQGTVEVLAGSFHVVTPTVQSYGPTSAGLDEVVTIKGSGFGDFLKIAEETRIGLHQQAHAWQNYELGADVSRSEVMINGIAAMVVSWKDDEIKVRVPRRHVFGIGYPGGFHENPTKGEIIVRRGSWDFKEDGTCCKPKKWVSEVAGPFTILRRGLPHKEFFYDYTSEN